MKSVRQLGVLAGVWVSAWALSAGAQGDPSAAPVTPPAPTAPAPAAPDGRAPDQPPPAPTATAPAPATPPTATAPPAPAPPPTAAPPPSYPAPPYRAPAYGQPAYGQPGYPPPGYYNYPAPPPPPPPDDTVERHDGLYLSFGLSFGYFKNSIAYDSGPIGDEKVSKGDVSFEFLLGGTPAPGVVIGGGLLAWGVGDPNVEVDGQTVKNSELRSMSVASLGPFVDFYPDDKGGFHVQGFVGLSQLSFEDDRGQSDSSEEPTGYSLAGAVGYDFWVGDQWSIGVLGRFMYSSLAVTVDDIDRTHHVLSPTLGVRGLLH